MRIQNPANHAFASMRGQWCSYVRILALACLLSPVALPPEAHAQSGSAVIVGVERLYVRRGPGAEFPPFATLTKGDTVEVQEMQGEWARIVTGSGLSGYVRSNFLILPGEHRKPAPPPPTMLPQTAKPAAAVKPTPTPKNATTTATGQLPLPTVAEPTTLRAAHARAKSLEAEIQRLQQQIAELKGHADGGAAAAPLTATTPGSGTPAAVESPEMTTTPSPTPTPLTVVAGDTDSAQAEIVRLTTLVETLQRRLDARPPIEGLTAPVGPSDNPAHSWSSALTLGIIGAALGWFVGSIWGRKPDRGRRPRIRF